MSDRKKTKKQFDYRLALQIFFFILIAAIAVNHTLDEMGKAVPVLSSASLRALCPFGGGVSIYQFASAGTYVKKTHESSFVLMINNPSDIRGSYSFEDVYNAFEVPAEVLAKAFGVAHLENPAGFKCKQLEEMYAGLSEREIGARGTTIRDFCTDDGVEFSEFKVTLQEKMDSIQ